MAAVGTCVEQPTERQGTIQSASTTHTRQHRHHARRDRFHLEARSTAVRKNAQSYLTICGTGATRAETASTPHTTDAGEIGKGTNSPPWEDNLPCHVASNIHEIFFFGQVTDPKFHNELDPPPTTISIKVVDTCHQEAAFVEEFDDTAKWKVAPVRANFVYFLIINATYSRLGWLVLYVL